MSRKLITYILTIIAMAMWGITYIWSEEVFHYLSPTATVYFRIVIAALFLILNLAQAVLLKLAGLPISKPGLSRSINIDPIPSVPVP